MFLQPDRHLIRIAIRLTMLRAVAHKTGLPTAYDRHCRNLTRSEIEGMCSCCRASFLDIDRLARKLPYTIRLAMAEEGDTVVSDVVYGPITFENKYIEDQVCTLRLFQSSVNS